MFRTALLAGLRTNRAVKRILLACLLLALPFVLVSLAAARPGLEVDSQSATPAWQEPFVIKNLVSMTESSAIYTPASNDKYLVFTTDGPPQDNAFSRELWRTEGTADTTIKLEKAADRVYDNLYFLGDKLIFTVRTDELGTELWTSDLTPDSAELLIDLVPGSSDLAPEDFMVSGNYLYFVGWQEFIGSQVWRTDGTVAGTIRLTGPDLGDINYVPSNSNYQQNSLLDFNGSLYFFAQRKDESWQLTRSDGTVAGTGLAVQMPNTFEVYGIHDLGATSSFMVFQHFGQLWRSDGTQAGTFPLQELGPGEEFDSITPAEFDLYFVKHDANYKYQLWKSGGQIASTVKVTDLPAWTVVYDAVGNSLFFGVNDIMTGIEPWTSDGTAAGTKMLKDIRPGNGDSISPGELSIVVDDKIFFLARSNDSGGPSSVWRSDLTTAGTQEVILEPPDPNDFYGPALISAFKHELFFQGHDTAHGGEPWLTKGGGVSASMIKDINVIDSGGSMPYMLHYTNDHLFFMTNSGGGLWTSDGSAEGTELLVPYVYDKQDISTSRDEMDVANGWLYFILNNAVLNQSELWRTNGVSTAGIGAWEGTHSLDPARDFTAATDWVYFLHWGEQGHELWRTDGFAAGTRGIIRFVGPSYIRFEIHDLVTSGNLAYFVVSAQDFGSELWMSDGTGAGSRRVKRIGSETEEVPDLTDLTVMNGILYFTADDGVHGRELWHSDGTEAGTYIVRDIFPGQGSSGLADLTVFNGVLYFSADDGTHGRELWRSDGTDRGTLLIKDIAPGSVPSDPVELVAGLDWLYFVGADPVHSYQVWKTDGSFASTKRVTNFVIDSIEWPHHLSVVDNTVFFLFGYQESGIAYQSDGTEAGTFSHEEMFPDSGFYGDYREMTAAPGRLFFAAPNLIYGDEPASVIVSPTFAQPSQLFLSQGGNWKPYKLSLSAPPRGQVVINISSSDPTVQIGPNQLTFTAQNWNVPQSVNVRAVVGGTNPESRAATIEHKLATADATLNGAATSMPVQIRNWRFGFLPYIGR